MKTRVKIILFVLVLSPFYGFAQQPKLNIRALIGVNARDFVYRVEGLEPDVLAGWQLGAGLRVSRRRVFANLDVLFVNSGTTLLPEESGDIKIEDPLTMELRAIELPISAGYIPVKTPIFKWFLYGGLANRINIKGKVKYQGETTKFTPNQAGLQVYNLGARIGTQIDFTIFTFDVNYTIGVTNAYSDVIRTNSHEIQLSVGIVF